MNTKEDIIKIIKSDIRYKKRNGLDIKNQKELLKIVIKVDFKNQDEKEHFYFWFSFIKLIFLILYFLL